MKLAICCNHSWPHTGGVERIVQQISESMAKDFSHNVTVIRGSLKTPTSVYNNVNYIRCHQSPMDFFMFLKKEKFDHIFTYSDFFNYWPIIVSQSEKIPGTKSIALCGMLYTSKRTEELNLLKSKKDKFKFIVHSKLSTDYICCQQNNLETITINQGIDLKEFDNNLDFRKKYDIKDKKIIVYLANFFPCKGQIEFAQILQSVKNKDYIALFICSDVNFGYAKNIQSQCEAYMKNNKINYKIVKNIPREDVISALKTSDMLVMSSLKEVGPLCVLESMAAKRPWVAFSTGQIPSLKGGTMIRCPNLNADGQIIFNNSIKEESANVIDKMLNNVDEQTVLNGYNQIITDFNWDLIKKQYNEVFERP